MKRPIVLAIALAGALLAGCQPTVESDQAFGARVRAYLLAHPEVLEQASEKLQAQQDAQAVAAQHAAVGQLPALRAALERDPRDFVANPTGKITVTEFYDYRCPHCANIAPKLVALIHNNPDIRFVFKEMPIFGATSEHAAYAAMAVKKDGGDYLALYQKFMAARPLDDAAIDKIAEAEGARAADIPPDAASTAHLAANSALFTKLGLDGTPGFVIDNQIIDGEAMDQINAAIAQARAGKA